MKQRSGYIDQISYVCLADKLTDFISKVFSPEECKIECFRCKGNCRHVAKCSKITNPISENDLSDLNLPVY
jgi:hypothetical protein